MVLCKYMLQGYCRFGTRCDNEHVDIKHVIKTDVEAALNGNQWPLSCYGPFKDKPCIPNLIEDQSYEEIRFLCYEAKQKNFFDQFHQQFTKEVLDAKNKFKALLQVSPAVINVFAKVYDSPLDTACGVSAGKPNNPFDKTSSATGPSPSMFGQITPAASGVSAFGNTLSAQKPIFPQNTTATNSSIFGGAAMNPVATGFGQSSQNSAASGAGIFAQAANSAPSTGLFAQASQQSTNMGLFAQAAQQTAPLFAQQQQSHSVGFSQAQPQFSGNIFAQQLQPQEAASGGSTGLFASTPTETVFQQNQQPANVFAQQTQNTSNATLQSTAAQIVSPSASTQSTAKSSIYSCLEELSATEIEAFKADQFTKGKIPFSPPPKELIN